MSELSFREVAAIAFATKAGRDATDSVLSAQNLANVACSEWGHDVEVLEKTVQNHQTFEFATMRHMRCIRCGKEHSNNTET